MPRRRPKARWRRRSQTEQPIAEAAIARIRRVYPALPERLRYVGPYQEAVARLSGRRRSELLTQWANQLWIGREASNDVCNQHVLIRSRPRPPTNRLGRHIDHRVNCGRRCASGAEIAEAPIEQNRL